MSMETSWSIIKNFSNTYSVPIHWIDLGTQYFLRAFQGEFSMTCILQKDSGSDQTDFETNYKPSGNIVQATTSVIQSQPPYGAKTIVVNGAVKKLYARNIGLQFNLSEGSNTLTYIVALAWAKLLGVEAINSEALDTVDFKVFDNAQGTYSGTPNALLNQFAYSLNLPAGYYQRFSQFDADVYAGMVIQMTYVSKSAKTIGFNLLMDEVK